MAKKLDSLKRGSTTSGLLENGTLLQRWQPIRSQPSGAAQLCRDVIKPDLSPTERENTPVRHWHTICIKAVQNALTVDWDVDSSLQKVLNQLQVEPVARPIDAETGRSFSESGVGAALQRVSAKPAKTNPASGVKRFHPFHSMYCDEEEAEAAPTMWMDLSEGRVEPEPPNRYDTLIAEFAGEVEEDRGRIFKKCSFSACERRFDHKAL